MKLGHFIPTLENLEEVVAEEPVEAAETATETAELGGELQADEAQIGGVDSGIEDAGVAAGQIDELTEVAEDSLAGEGETVPEPTAENPEPVGQEGEGLTEGEATMIEISHESIMASIGFTVDRRTYTAESFTSKRNKREVTLEALDKLKESATKIKDNVIKALKAAFEAVVGFVSKLLANRALMEKHLANLAGRVASMPDGAPKSPTVTAGASVLSLDGQANAGTAMKVVQGADQVLGVAKSIAELLYQKRDLAQAEELGQSVQKSISALPAHGEGRGILGGGRSFKTDMDDTSKGDGDVMSLEVVDGGKNAENIAVASKAELGNLIKAAQGTLTALRDAEKIRSRLKDVVAAAENAFHRVVSEATSRVGTEASKAKGSAHKAFYKAAAVVRKAMTKFMTTAFSNAFKVVKAVADYTTACIKNVGGGGAEKPEGQAA